MSCAKGRASATQLTSDAEIFAMSNEAAMAASGSAPGVNLPRDFFLFDRRYEIAILQYGAGRVLQDTTQSENDHFDFFSILAQVSRSATVRLKTSLSGVESGSTAK